MFDFQQMKKKINKNQKILLGFKSSSGERIKRKKKDLVQNVNLNVVSREKQNKNIKKSKNKIIFFSVIESTNTNK